MLGERHAFDEWQETVSTFIMNLAAAPAEDSASFANMSRHEFRISENMSRKLELAYEQEALRAYHED
ncbi:hypothetical protein D3C76_1497130 [compost metagenome]